MQDGIVEDGQDSVAVALAGALHYLHVVISKKTKLAL
jgi:hypothetical protein